jgi:hypothetical protein
LVELTHCGPGSIQSNRSASDHDDPVTEIYPKAAVEVEQIIDGLDHTIEVVAGDVEIPATSRSHRYEKRLESLLPQRAQVVLFGQGGVRSKRRPEVLDGCHLPVDHRARQSVVGDAVAEHPAGIRQGFEYSHVVAENREVVGARHTGRTTTDDRNLLPRMMRFSCSSSYLR